MALQTMDIATFHDRSVVVRITYEDVPRGNGSLRVTRAEVVNGRGRSATLRLDVAGVEQVHTFPANTTTGRTIPNNALSLIPDPDGGGFIFNRIFTISPG